MFKIGIDGHMLGDKSGGNESYYENILLNMTVPSNCNIYLFVNKGVDVSKYQDKFKIVYFKYKNPFMRNFFEIPNLAKKLKLDLIHMQYFIPFYRPCKIVCTIHDICFEHYKNIFTKSEYYRQKILIPYAAKHSERVITVSEFSKNDIMKHYNISNDKIIVTYNAVNDAFKKFNDNSKIDSVKKRFDINDDYILTVSNIQPRKNLVRLIKAFVQLEKEYDSSLKLVVVGKKAWMYNETIKAARGESENIIFTDYVNKDDLISLYNGASCFVYPSFFEGFGIPPLESMACGTPVVVSNVTSLPEVVGDAGLYFDPYNIEEMANQIKKVLSDEELKLELEKKGYNQILKFSWKESAKKIVKLYLNILENK